MRAIIEKSIGLSNTTLKRRCNHCPQKNTAKVSAIRKNLFSRNSTFVQLSGKLVHPAGNCNYQQGADYRCYDNSEKVGADNVEAFKQPHSGRHEKEPDIFYQEIGNAANPLLLDDTDFQCCSERYHADDA